MAPPAYEPTFFLLKRRLPASESANLLGRVVRRYEDPTLDYTPECPATALSLSESESSPKPEPFTSFLLAPTHDDAATLTASRTRSTSHHLSLPFPLLASSSSSSSSAQASTTITSPRVTTRRLKREQAYFAALKSVPGVRRRMLDMCGVGERVYLVVGTMALRRGTFRQRASRRRGRESGVAVPVGLAAAVAGAAAAGGGIPLGLEVVPDAEVGISRADVAGSTATFSTTSACEGGDDGDDGDGGEEVFAVACKVIRRTWRGLGRDVKVRGRQPEYRGGQHLGSDDEDEDDDGSERDDENDLDEETERMIAEGLVLSDEVLDEMDAGMKLVIDSGCRGQVGR